MKTQKQREKDIYAMRKRRKRRRVLRQGIIFLLMAVAVLVLYQRRDSWIPTLETIGHRHQTYRSEEADAADGDLPIYLYSGSEPQLATISNRLLVLSDSYLQIYDTDGHLLTSRQHTYGSAVMRTAGEYALVYESGGMQFRVETAAKTRFEKLLSDPIVFGRISPGGLIALVTSSDTCACKLLVFNLKGQLIYERDCIEELTDLSFHSDESGCYASSIYTENGRLYSLVHSYSFTEYEDLWTSKPLDMMAISVYNTSGGDVFVLGDSQCCFLAAGGALKSTFVYPDTLRSGVFSGNTAALLLENTEKRTRTVVVINGNASTPVLRSYDKEIRSIGLVPEQNAVLIQFRNHFEAITSAGETMRSLSVADSYEGFLKIEDYLFLRSYDHIDRIDYQK